MAHKARWPLRRVVAALAGAFLLAGPVAAQTVDCNRLALQIATLSRSKGSAQAAAAARKQQAEIARTRSYAKSIGCNRAHFLFFDDRPAQCDGVNARIERMEANYARLQRAAYGDSSGLKRQLQNQYETYCRGGRREPNFLERLFGEPDRTYPPEQIQTPDDQQDVRRPLGGSEAVCVRTCDGGFFPVSYSARRADLSELQERCSALCPNAEVKVYTRSLSGSMNTAVSADGAPYTEMPNAFKFEKAVVPQCACKPPNESWAQALTGAEELLAAHKGDLLVTPEKAAELSRAPTPGAPSSKGKAKKDRGFDPQAMQKFLDRKRQEADAETEAERKAAEEAPTASNESSGIDFGQSATGSLREDDATIGVDRAPLRGRSEGRRRGTR